MGRRSKATQSWLQNLREASKSQRTQVDDVTSDEDEDSESSGDATIVVWKEETEPVVLQVTSARRARYVHNAT